MENTKATLKKLPKKQFELFDMIMTFIVPTIVGKSLILYFGLNYSENPGEGYGTGLLISILFTVIMIIRFLWRYRNYED